MRRTRIAPRSAKRIAAIPERVKVRAIVLARDRVCQLAAAGRAEGYAVGPCFGPLEVHERRKASQGGRYSEANGVAVCSAHNTALESDADLARFARRVGLVLLRGDE